MKFLDKVFSKDNIYLINDNCFEPTYDLFLENLDGGIDLILTDPPFNIAEKGKVTKAHGKIYSNKEAWGSTFKDKFTKEEYDEFIRLFVQKSFKLLNDGASLCSFIDRKYSGRFIEICEQEGFIFKNEIIFVKRNCVPKVRAYNFGSATEKAIWLIKPNKGKTKSGKSNISKTRPRIFNNQKARKGLSLDEYHNTHSSNVFFYNIGKKLIGHPTEKYVKQIEPLIRTLSNKNSWILDPFGGCFSSAVVAKNLNRKYVGFEIIKDFWGKGVDYLRRLSNDIK